MKAEYENWTWYLGFMVLMKWMKMWCYKKSSFIAGYKCGPLRTHAYDFHIIPGQLW